MLFNSFLMLICAQLTESVDTDNLKEAMFEYNIQIATQPAG
jgi:hypothetical protein